MSAKAALRSRIGPLLLEATMVVFAVLVALAVDEWRAERELRGQVVRARAAIEAELASNRDELLASLPTVSTVHDDLRDMARRMRAGETVREWAIEARIPDFSDAAWETARQTGVMAHMEYAWVLQTARVYETQELALLVQNGLLGTLGGALVRDPELERVTDLQGQLFMLLQMYDGLQQKYSEALSATDPELRPAP